MVCKYLIYLKGLVDSLFFDTIKCNNQYLFLIFNKIPICELYDQTINNKNNNQTYIYCALSANLH